MRKAVEMQIGFEKRLVLLFIDKDERMTCLDPVYAQVSKSGKQHVIDRPAVFLVDGRYEFGPQVVWSIGRHDVPVTGWVLNN